MRIADMSVSEDEIEAEVIRMTFQDLTRCQHCSQVLPPEEIRKEAKERVATRKWADWIRQPVPTDTLKDDVE